MGILIEVIKLNEEFLVKEYIKVNNEVKPVSTIEFWSLDNALDHYAWRVDEVIHGTTE